MRHRTIWLATAGLAYSSPNVFSVYDDLLAFPQYEIIFSDTFISDKDAESRLAYVASSSDTRIHTSTITVYDATASPEPATELSNRRQRDGAMHSANYDLESATDSYESMILNGKPYLCAIPIVEIPQKNESTIAQSKAEEEAELVRAADRGWELLKDMDGQCMYFISGWWSYSFCYNLHVKQFHQLPPGQGAPIFPPVEDPTTPSYVLGKFTKQSGRENNKQVEGGAGTKSGRNSASFSNPTDDPTTTTALQAKGEVRYLVQKLSGGTPCDLTGRDRKIEIQFHCHPQTTDRIGWIKELATCSYLMVVYTPRLCNDAAFLPPRENRANPVTCREVVKELDIPVWESRKAMDLQRKLVNAGPSGRPVVGGIEVGGMKHVGKEGQRVEIPMNIQPGNGGGGTVDLLAKQDPAEKGGRIQKLSDEELKRIGLDPARVQEAREDLVEAAGGRRWRLEAFDTMNGEKELRGVLEGDDGEVDGKGGDAGREHGRGKKGEDGEETEKGEGSEEVYKDEL